MCACRMGACRSSRCGYLTESASNSRELTSAEMAHVERAVASFIRSESAYVSLPTLPKFRACSGMLKVHAAQRHSGFRALPLPHPPCFVCLAAAWWAQTVVRRAVSAAATARTDVDRLVVELREVDDLIRDNERKIEHYSTLITQYTAEDEQTQAAADPATTPRGTPRSLPEGSATRTPGDNGKRGGAPGAAATPLPSRELLPHSHPAPAVTLATPAQFKRLLTGGAVFLKHGRRGVPHPRFVWVTPELDTVCWRALGTRSCRSLAVGDLVDVRAGQSTPVFLRNKGRPTRDFASFSLVFVSGRSLDLEVRHQHDVCRAVRCGGDGGELAMGCEGGVGVGVADWVVCASPAIGRDAGRSVAARLCRAGDPRPQHVG